MMLFIYFSLHIFGEDNISIATKYQYNNILKLNSTEIDSEVNSDLARTNITWMHNNFGLGFNLYREYTFANLSGLNTDIIYPLEISNNDIVLDEELLYPELFFTYENSRIDISMLDEPQVTYSLNLPLLSFLSLGLDKKVIYSSTDSIDIFGSYVLSEDTYLSKQSIAFDFHKNWLELGIYYNSFGLTYDYDSSLDGNIGLNLDIKSDFSGSLYAGYKSNNFSIKGSVDYTRFNLSEDPIYIYYEGSLAGGATNPGDLEMLSLILDTSFSNTAISLSYNRYKIDDFTCYFTSNPFIYSTLAYEKYNFTIPEINLQCLKAEVIQKIELPLCDLNINLQYSRYFIDLDDISYSNKGYVWSLWSYTLLSSETDTFNLDYDHINIVNLAVSATFPLTENISIISSGSQILPFFDENISNIFVENSGSSSSSSSNNDSISGGTTLSLEFRLML